MPLTHGRTPPIPAHCPCGTVLDCSFPLSAAEHRRMPPIPAQCRAAPYSTARSRTMPPMSARCRAGPLRCRSFPLFAAEHRQIPPTSAYCRAGPCSAARSRSIPLGFYLLVPAKYRSLPRGTCAAARCRTEMALLGHHTLRISAIIVLLAAHIIP